MDVIFSAVTLAIVASTPLLLAVLGELVVQRSGVINLGVEGMLLAGALSGAATAEVTGSVLAGLLGGIAGASIVGLLFGFFAITLKTDQIVAGTALNLLALGGTSFVYRELRQSAVVDDAVPHLAHDWVTPFAWIIAPLLVWLFVWRTMPGLRLRACGESPDAARSAGVNVARHRWLAIAIESVLAGIGGAHLAISLSSGFAENMSAGRGFIALAIVIFGRWGVRGALAGTALFSVAAALQYAAQAAGSALPFHLMLAVPYVVTLLFLAGLAGHVRAPESLGK